MSKLIGEPVRVHLDKEALPDAFIWRKRLYRVGEIISWWREPAEWWNDKSIRNLADRTLAQAERFKKFSS